MLRRAHEDWQELRVLPRFRRVRGAKARPHLRDLIAFAVDTGARRGEALGLEWPEVDLNADRPRVHFLDTKTGVPRGVPLPNRCSDMLKAKRELAIELVGEAVGRVFVLWREARWELVPFDDPKKSFRTAREAADLGSDATFHVPRHTYASRLVQRGVPLYDVAKLLGHSSIRMTERYAHLAPEGLDRAVQMLDT